MARSNTTLLSLEGSKVRHLRFEDMGPNTLKASWDSADGKVLGYRVRCRRQTGPSSVLSVSPQIHSVLLTDLAAGTTNKVCVKPMYKNQAGKGLCRMVHMQPGELGCTAASWGLQPGESVLKGTEVLEIQPRGALTAEILGAHQLACQLGFIAATSPRHTVQNWLFPPFLRAMLLLVALCLQAGEKA